MIHVGLWCFDDGAFCGVTRALRRASASEGQFCESHVGVKSSVTSTPEPWVAKAHFSCKPDNESLTCLYTEALLTYTWAYVYIYMYIHPCICCMHVCICCLLACIVHPDGAEAFMYSRCRPCMCL